MLGATELSLGAENEDFNTKRDSTSKADASRADSFFTSRAVTVLPVGGVVPRPRAPSFSPSASRGTRTTSGGETTPTTASMRKQPSTPTSTPTTVSTPIASSIPYATLVSTPISPSSQWSPERTGHHPVINPTYQSNLIQSVAAYPAHPSKRLIPPPPPNPNQLTSDSDTNRPATTDPATATSDGDQLLLFSQMLSNQWDEMEYSE